MKLDLALRLVWVLARARTPIVVTDDLVRLTDRRSRREAMNGPAAVALPTLLACREGYLAIFTKHNGTITPPERTTVDALTKSKKHHRRRQVQNVLRGARQCP